MNNKIYYLINDADYSEICYSSYDKSLLEEIMYDEFFNDVMIQFYECIKTLNWKRACFWYNRIWEEMLAYYDDYVHIEESEII